MSYSDLTLRVAAAFLFLESRRDFSGVVFVISEKSEPSSVFWKVYMGYKF